MWTPSYRKFKDTLMSMCRMTTPHGTEAYVWPMLPSPPFGAAPNAARHYAGGTTRIDAHGNYIVVVPGEGQRIMWTAHCDTADSHPTLVNLKFKNGMLSTDRKSILGADDKVGCAIMAMMIRSGCPGTYCFFAGEEVGCVGSEKFADDTEMLDYDCCISLDRRGYDSVITHQCGRRTASDEWANSLGKIISQYTEGVIDMSADPTGVFTDSREFRDLIPECTNLSVGYFNQHTHDEKTNVDFSFVLCMALIHMVHDGVVPTPVRDITVLERGHSDLPYGWSSRDFDSKFPPALTDPDSLSEDDWRNYDWKAGL